MDETNETKTEKPKKLPKPMSERSAVANLMSAMFVLGVGTGILIAGLADQTERMDNPDAEDGGAKITVGALVAVCGFLLMRGVPRGFRATWTSRFAKDKAAVSPVIAVILMVAITVVLAAAVFVLVSDIGREEISTAPSMSFDADEQRNTVTIVSIQSTTLKWGDLTVKGCTAPSGMETVDPGDTLGDCSGWVSIEHGPSRTLVYRHEFD